MKPLEFKIEERLCEGLNATYYIVTFYYEDGTQNEYQINNLPKGLELNKHYSIADIYGYQVKNDREGL